MMTLSAGQPFVRYSFAGFTSLIATFFLFLLMQHLIQNPGILPPEATPSIPIQIVNLKPPEEKPPVDQTKFDRDDLEPPPVLTIDKTTTGHGIDIYIPGFEGQQSPGFKEWDVLEPDKDPIILVRINPDYPGPAITRGTEGYVILEYSVDSKGATRDIRVIESNPPGVFDEAAIRAISKYKYQPAIKDGKAVMTTGIQEKFVFEIED